MMRSPLFARGRILCGCLLAVWGTVPGPSWAAATSPMAVSTNLAGTYSYRDAPAGFSPLVASDAELDRFGYPPRPNATGNPAALAAWSRAMASARSHITTPQLIRSPVRHGPAIGRTMANLQGTATSTNWSGYVLTNTAPPYSGNSVWGIGADWVVPIGGQPIGSCAGPLYSASWTGIDGWDNNDVLQAGTESDSNCAHGKVTSHYYAG